MLVIYIFHVTNDVGLATYLFVVSPYDSRKHEKTNYTASPESCPDGVSKQTKPRRDAFDKRQSN